MNAKDVALNFGIPLYMIAIQLGTRPVKFFSLIRTLPTIIGIGIFILVSIPRGGNDLAVHVCGVLIGGLLGAIAGLFIRVRTASSGKLLMTAGLGYASIWLGVAVARFMFAYLSTHGLHRQIADFTRTLHVTGKPAISAFFILLSVTMALARTKILLFKAVGTKARAPQIVGESV